MAGIGEVLSLPATWALFLPTVPGAVEDVAPLATQLAAAGWAAPLSFVHADASDVLGSVTVQGPVKAFLRRAVLAATKISVKMEEQAEAAANSQGAADVASSQIVPATQPELVSSLQALLGTEHSALQVAEALASGVEKPKVAQILKEAGLEDLQDEFCPANEVFTAMTADSQLAKKKSLVPFTYVELTNQALLPDFLPPEAIGGKTFVPGQDECLGNYMGNITQFSAALKALTSAPRCFRNITQWSLAFSRYAIAAVAVGQVNWTWVITHMQMVLRIASEETPLIAILYDEISRKQWARRAAKGDATLVILTETSVKSLPTLELARSKVKLVTKVAGLRDTPDNVSNAPSSHMQDAQSALTKQIAAAQQAQRQAESAMNNLQRQRQNNAGANQRGNSNTKAGRKGGGKGGAPKQGQKRQGGNQWGQAVKKWRKH